MTHSHHYDTQFSFYGQRSWMQVPPYRERTQCFQFQVYRSRAMWPCCDFTSSHDDEHNTDNNFCVLFADVDFTPTLLDSPWIFSRFRSNFPQHLILKSPHLTHLDHAHRKGLTFHVSLCMGGTRGCTVSVLDVLTSTTPVLPALGHYSVRPLSAPQSLCMFILTLAPLAQCTHCHFVLQARAVRVPELCDDHTPPSCLVACPPAKLRQRSVNMLVLPDPWLTQGGQVTFLACALYQLFVRSCDLAHHGLHCHMSVLAFVIFSSQIEEQQNVRLSLGTLSGIILTARAIRSQHYILPNSFKLVRASRPLCRCRPPHDCHMVQRLQVLCPAHRTH